VICIQDKGEATLLIPPKSIIPEATNALQSDVRSIGSTSSRYTIQYQRPFQVKANPSLTDLRSAQVRLRHSITISMLSSESSGMPGIGYLSGKVVKWVGMQMLKAFTSIEIYRRRWIIGKLVKEMGKMDLSRRGDWLVEKQREINRAVDDMLELSSYINFTWMFAD
jgi:hypothetical protein